jgi:hypothetical protein
MARHARLLQGKDGLGLLQVLLRHEHLLHV